MQIFKKPMQKLTDVGGGGGGVLVVETTVDDVVDEVVEEEVGVVDDASVEDG